MQHFGLGTRHQSSDIYRVHEIFKLMHSRVRDSESNQRALMFQVRGLILFKTGGGDDTAAGARIAANLKFFTLINRVQRTPQGEENTARRQDTRREKRELEIWVT